MIEVVRTFIGGPLHGRLYSSHDDHTPIFIESDGYTMRRYEKFAFRMPAGHPTLKPGIYLTFIFGKQPSIPAVVEVLITSGSSPTPVFPPASTP